MIVLDAVNKSLVIHHGSGISSMSVSTVASYWSVDITTNVWTVASFETTTGIFNDTVSPIILPSPAAGTVNVLENLWIELLSIPSSDNIRIALDTGGIKRNLIRISSGTAGIGSTILLDRDGNFSKVAL